MENNNSTYAVGTDSSIDRSRLPLPMRREQALTHATRLFEKRIDWLSYFRQIMGTGGFLRQLFPSQEEFAAFEQSPEFEQIEKMLYELRAQKRNPKPNKEPTRVITVRLPESIHEALHAEATEHGTSVNKLCIAKLLHTLSQEMLPPPSERSNRGSAGYSAASAAELAGRGMLPSPAPASHQSSASAIEDVNAPGAHANRGTLDQDSMPPQPSSVSQSHPANEMFREFDQESDRHFQ